jgi:cytochrome P450
MQERAVERMETMEPATLRDYTPARRVIMDAQEKTREVHQLFIKYLEDLFEQRRQQPRDDLISALLAVQEQGDRLSAEELTSMVFVLLVGGYETTGNLLGNGLLALLQHPDQLQRLREDRSLIPSAVEEMLRYCGPFELSILRFAKEDLELHGQRIQAHEAVRVNYLAADRDAGQFSEPDRFDVGRTPNKHVAFGHGIHFCLGAPWPGWRPLSPSSCCWSGSRSCVWPRRPRSSRGARVPSLVGW